jgi:YD repeat-containing protein
MNTDMRNFIALLLVVVAFFECKAQSPAFSKNLIKVNTLSPDAASLGKFGNIPVSNYTGTPSIKIPVYDIKIGDINFPISLDYHASGIKVEEAASSVGLGWALNAPLLVTRNVQGLPDEMDYFGSPDPYDVQKTPAAFFDYIHSVAQVMGRKDSEPDIYNYNTGNSSGKFVFKRDRSVYQIPLTNNVIVKDHTGSFKITEPNGVQYIYEEKRYVFTSVDSDIPYISTWCLTKIISSNQEDTIYLKYDPNSRIGIETQEMFSEKFGTRFGVTKFIPDDGFKYHTKTSYNSLFFLTEVYWRGGKITLTYVDDRIDLSGAKRLAELKIFSNLNTTLNLVKHVKLHQSNLTTPLLPNTQPYNIEKFSRLRLDSVSIRDVASSSDEEWYKLTYNDIELPNRGSYAQDRWGFYNGKDSNGELMPAQIFLFLGNYEEFGSANRATDAVKIKAGTISSIQYPTKGKSVFDFEPHQFHSGVQPSEVKSLGLELCCFNFPATAQSMFTVNSLSSKFRYKVNISKYNYPEVSSYPKITLTDLTTGNVVFSISNMNANEDYASNSNFNTTPLNLIQGHTYKIQLDRFTTTANVTIRFELRWDETIPNASDIMQGGGLRIKSVTNYDAKGSFVNKDAYTYGSDGTGRLITPWAYHGINYTEITKSVGLAGEGQFPEVGCQYSYEDRDHLLGPLYSGFTTEFSAQGVLPTTNFAGSPVVYPKVTISKVDEVGVDLGKTEFGYSFFEDGPQPPLQYLPRSNAGNLGYLSFISSNWKNGILHSKKEYKRLPTGSYVVLSDVFNRLDHFYYRSTYPYLHLIEKTNHDGCRVLNVGDFIYSINEFTSGATVIENTTTNLFDETGSSISSSKDFTYGLTPLLPIKIIETDSYGKNITEHNQYPKDLAALGNVYNKLVTRNILDPVVNRQIFNNGLSTSLLKIEYTDWFGDSKLLLPQSVSEQIGSNPLEVKIEYNAFDSYGNILQQRKSNDGYQAYLWDYQSTYPIAQVSNADRVSIAYTSFEADGKGNWVIPSTSRDGTTPALTGKRSYVFNGGNAISKGGLNAATTYIVSYWKRGGSVGGFTVSGTTQSLVGETVNSWTYHEHTIKNVTSLSVAGSSGNIDELRLYPKGAQMTTFTYTPLVGMTSSADANGRPTYFKYDGLNRLKTTLDYKGNILKTYHYQYKY